MTKELIDYFKGDELAAGVWLSKYAAEGENTPNDMHRRMAKEFARIDLDYQNKEKDKLGDNLSEYGRTRENLNEDIIFDLFKDFKHIVPQGRVMAGLGVNDTYRSLSNCLRLPNPKDSYSSILYVDTMLVSSAKRGCGYGLGLSNLRPNTTRVTNAAKTSTGAVSFMERYSNSTREVGQNSRRGACLLDMEINHPDSLDFMTIKHDLTKVTGANISLFFNDEFLNAVKNDDDYILAFPCDFGGLDAHQEFIKDLPYNTLEEIENGEVFIKKIRAKEYWDTFCNSALKFAEPGCFFRTRFDNYSPSNVYEQYREIGTNACGEQPMADFDTCRLIVQNLFSVVKNPFTKNAYVDFDLLYKISYETQRLCDNLVDLECEYVRRIINKIKSDDIPKEEKEIELTLWNNVYNMAKNGRRTGCGITALGDMLAAMNLKYDSDAALHIVQTVMHTKMKAELDCSIDMAITRGTFVGWDVDKEFIENEGILIDGANDFYQFILEEFPEQAVRMANYGRRNINFSTIAPCGSVSILTGTTSGCEPLFMPYYTRRRKINPNDKNARIDFVDQNGDSWTEYAVLHPKFKDWLNFRTDLMYNIRYDNPNISVDDLSKEELNYLFEESPWYKCTANDIDWEKRVNMQSILQKYTSSAISSTLNLPSTTTMDIVSNIYLKSWEMGLKGQTIYVDGSRSGVLVVDNKKDAGFSYNTAFKRPKEVQGELHKTKINGEKFSVVVGLIDGKPYEIFGCDYHEEDGKSRNGIIKKISKGNYVFDDIQLTANMTDEQAVITRLVSTSLRHGADIKFIVDQLNKGCGTIVSFTKVLARVLKKYIPNDAEIKVACTECGSDSMIYEEGCKKCTNCGYSAC